MQFFLDFFSFRFQTSQLIVYICLKLFHFLLVGFKSVILFVGIHRFDCVDLLPVLFFDGMNCYLMVSFQFFHDGNIFFFFFFVQMFNTCRLKFIIVFVVLQLSNCFFQSRFRIFQSPLQRNNVLVCFRFLFVGIFFQFCNFFS